MVEALQLPSINKCCAVLWWSRHIVWCLRCTNLFTTDTSPVVSRKKTWRKTIVLVSVKKSVKGKEKSGAVCYDITQVVVHLSPATCNVKEVSQLIAKQVDFDVVLLDSKGYPLLDNESTTGESFWKSTRKILAANKQLYRKVTGQNTDIERASTDLRKEDSSDNSDILLPSVKRRKCANCGDSSTIADKIEDISKQVSGLAESITFMQNMQRSLECRMQRIGEESHRVHVLWTSNRMQALREEVA